MRMDDNDGAADVVVDSGRICPCALSGMSTIHDVNRYRAAGVGMCLIGESLMRSTDPRAAIRGLCLDPADCHRRMCRSASPSSSSSGGGRGRGVHRWDEDRQGLRIDESGGRDRGVSGGGRI